MDLNFEEVKIDTEQVSQLYRVMSNLVYEDLDKQYKEGKISGATYAETWAKLMDSVVAGSMNTIANIQMRETPSDRTLKQTQQQREEKNIEEIDKESARKDCINEKNCEHVSAQTDLVKEQKAAIEYDLSHLKPKEVEFMDARIQGFNDNMMIKMLETQFNGWSVMFASGMLEESPAIISSDELSKLYHKMASQVGALNIKPKIVPEDQMGPDLEPSVRGETEDFFDNENKSE